MLQTQPNRFAQLQQNMISAGTQVGGSGNVDAALQRSRQLFGGIPSIFNTEKAESAVKPEDVSWNGTGSAPITGKDQWAAAGLADNVPRSLIATESGGNWGAKNGLGYAGLLQFGQARFADAVKAGAVPQGMSFEQYASNTPEGRAAQVSAANWHFADIDARIQKSGFDRLVGQTIGGVPLSMDAMRSMAHLGGFGGLSKFINTGGGYNPSDAFGTSLAAYGKTH